MPKAARVDGWRFGKTPRHTRDDARRRHGARAGIEHIVDRKGRAWTYDVNTNTNYNPDAEARAGRSGMDAIARHLDRLLREGTRAKAA